MHRSEGLRVAVVDDHEVVRIALCELIRELPGGAEPVPFSTGRAMCEQQPGTFHAALVDLNLPDVPGPVVLRRLSLQTPVLTLIAITGSADSETMRYALEAGAVTCLSKATGVAELKVYLQAALLGAVIIDPVIQQAVSRGGPTLRGRLTPSNLTVREIQVLEMLARGSTLRSVAEALFIGEATVRTHRHNIYSKLGVQSREEAALAFQELRGDRSVTTT